MTGTPDPISDDIWESAFNWMTARQNNPTDKQLEARFQTWISADPEHARAFDLVRSVWAAAPNLSPHLVEESKLPDINAAKAQPHIPHAMISRRRWLAGAGAMAAGLALFAGTSGTQKLFADLSTATGEFKSATLQDGSRVRLDTDTALRLQFTNHLRRATLLDGRVHFHVAHDTARPFVVAAGPARISVLGTQFDLRMTGNDLSVSVNDGRVAVDLEQRRLTPADGMKPGEKLRLDLGNGRVERGHATPEIDQAWRDGRLDVEDWSVAEVLEELDRYHRGVVLVSDDSFGRHRISGSFDLTRPAQAIRSVAASQGGKVRSLSPWVLLVSPA